MMVSGRLRPNIRRVVVVVPSLFTLFNLFFGFWAMVLASRGAFERAGWFIVFAGVLDMLDGRVARLSRTGSRFGAELDSLVDIVSFGVAPAYLMYQGYFVGAGTAAWIFCYFYVMAAAIRLARFNVTHAGSAKTHFTGLPSPAAGMTLATYWPFTGTALYDNAFAELPWAQLVPFLMIALTILMVSNVRYAHFPRASVRDARGLLGLAVLLCILFFGIWRPREFFFPLGIAYMTYGVLRAVVLGFLVPPEENDAAEIAGSIVIDDASPGAIDAAQGERRRGVPPTGGMG
jgi:CDP-diacylglycerol--serine O-phosphatidyltransferase